MAKNVQRVADLLGAKVVSPVPETGGGAFGAARLAQVVGALQTRLEPGRGKRPGRPTSASWVKRPKVPMSAATAEKLARLAGRMSTPERQVSPMQVAAQLLEDAVARLPDG
jgi:hypothetical protein